MGQEYRHGLVEYLLQEVAVGFHLGLQSSEGLSGEAHPLPKQGTHMDGESALADGRRPLFFTPHTSPWAT